MNRPRVFTTVDLIKAMTYVGCKRSCKRKTVKTRRIVEKARSGTCVIGMRTYSDGQTSATAVPFKAASLDKRAYKKKQKNKRTAGSLRLPHEAENKKIVYMKNGDTIYNNNKHLQGFFFTFILLLFFSSFFCVCVYVFVVVGPVYCLCRKHLPRTTTTTTTKGTSEKSSLSLSRSASQRT